MLKKLMSNYFYQSYLLNQRNIKTLLRVISKGKALDLGCDDGSWTVQINQDLQWYGIELVSQRVLVARKRGIDATCRSLEKKLPFSDNFFKVVHSNQVIEHLYDIDLFITESRRVLKREGYLLVSTENPASWHNIAALFLGWQMFSATNISSRKLGIGNPMSLHKNETFQCYGRTKTWSHNKLLTPRALSELLICYGFKILKIIGAGYYPLFPQIGLINPSHPHFYTVLAQKA